MQHRSRTNRALPALAATALGTLAYAQVPDAPPPPVKVYILAGQSNMVGMGDVRGARNRYTGVYLTADPAAPAGPMRVGRALYRIRRHGVHDAKAAIYGGAFDAAKDYGEETAKETKEVALGVADGTLPSGAGPHTCVVRGLVDVPATGTYRVHAGRGDSSHNVTKLDGRVVYRKSAGAPPAYEPIALEAGKRYRLEITYAKGGSTAFWMSRTDLRGKGDLETVTKRDGKFAHLVDAGGEWTVRDDVWFQEARIGFKGGPLTVAGRTIGPELGFGHVVGDHHDEYVVLVKTAMGNRALGWDFRPPSSGRKDPDNKWEGLEYRLMVEGVRKTLKALPKLVPSYDGRGYEIAGLAWWQGHKDGFSPEMIAEYEQNLVHLIRDVREEFGVPKLPVVIATVGFGGHGMDDKYLKILNAQMAVGDPKQHPELAGTVRTVDTRDFWREVDDSPVGQGHHYNRNAETYMLVGEALGRAMVDLLEGRAAVAAPRQPPRRVASASAAVVGDPEAARAALAPIILDGMVPQFVAKNRKALASEARLERGKRVQPFLRGRLYGLTEFYRQAGVRDYDWRVFGPDLRNVEWDYFSFDPEEQQPKDRGKPRFRKVTYPGGMATWFAPDFDPERAGWGRGLPPFGQYGGKLENPSPRSCRSAFCRCAEPPRSLWEKEVLLVRRTFDCPEPKPGRRYRIVIGGSAHVNAGEGYAIWINGRKLIEYPKGVGRRQGGQPRGAFVDAGFLKELQGGKVTIAATSFLRYFHPRRKRIPAEGHFSLWLEEMKIPPLDKGAK